MLIVSLDQYISAGRGLCFDLNRYGRSHPMRLALDGAPVAGMLRRRPSKRAPRENRDVSAVGLDAVGNVYGKGGGAVHALREVSLIPACPLQPREAW